MVNGDTLTSLSLSGFAAAHRDSGALVTMALIENPRPDVYGGVRVEDGWVRGFTRAGSGEPSYHFIGVQAARARAFLDLEDGVPAESVMGIYPRLIRENPRSILGYVADAPFKDIGTPADYLHTSLQLAASEGDRLVSNRAISRRSDGEGGADRRLGRRHDRQKLHARGVHRMRRCQRASGIELPADGAGALCRTASSAGRAGRGRSAAAERFEQARPRRPR